MNIAFIPARGGSRSILLKNIKIFCGKPLIYWVLIELEKAKSINKIIVATDSSEIEEIVIRYNFSKLEIYHREKENATHTSSTESVIFEYFSNSQVSDSDIFLLVQATSPFTQSKDFDLAVNKYINNDYDSLLSVVRLKRFMWDDNGNSLNYDYKNRPRRQDFNGILLENGAFYINKIKNIKQSGNRIYGKIGFYEMTEFTSLELDEPEDWDIGEFLMNKFIITKRSKDILNNIKLLVLDVDGVLTDSGMYYSEKGDECKKFSTKDGKGIELLHKSGIKTAIITLENTKIVEKRAEKLKIKYLYQGIFDKLKVVKEICKSENITLDEVAYIGDDLGDYEAMNSIGYSFCPVDAIDTIKKISDTILLKNGGEGCVREVCELILAQRKSI